MTTDFTADRSSAWGWSDPGDPVNGLLDRAAALVNSVEAHIEGKGSDHPLRDDCDHLRDWIKSHWAIVT